MTFVRDREGSCSASLENFSVFRGAALAASGGVFVINTINVDVRDVTDFVVRGAIRRAVTWTFRHLAGVWDVRVSASTEPGRWDLHVYGGFGHHVAHVLTSPERLAEHVERRLRAFLSGVVPPLPIAPRRPVLVPQIDRSLRKAYTPTLVRRFDEPRRKAS